MWNTESEFVNPRNQGHRYLAYVEQWRRYLKGVFRSLDTFVNFEQKALFLCACRKLDNKFSICIAFCEYVEY